MTRLCDQPRLLAYAITHGNYTESTIGYNNQLKQATPDMKLGVNSDINLGTKKASLQLMDGGPSTMKPPNSHPSNPIHKQAMEALGLDEKKKVRHRLLRRQKSPPLRKQKLLPLSRQTLKSNRIT